MKKILLSLLMLCTAVSAWSYDYETNTITRWCRDGNNGIVPESDLGMIMGQFDRTTETWKDVFMINYIGSGRVIVSVEFNMRSGSIDQCESGNGNWKVDDTGKWMQDGTFAYDESVTFKSTVGCLINSVTITYHKHTFTHHEAEAATCMATGMQEYWECSDCGHIYLDEKGASEATMASLVTDIAPTNHPGALEEHARVEASCIKEGHVQYWHCNLCNKNFKDEGGSVEISSGEMILSIDPTKHASALTKHEAVAATCVSAGSVQYWHCSDCDHCFKDEAGATQIAGDNVTTAIDPTNHADKLTEVAFKNASVVEDGVLHHWHCEACGNDYADADCTEGMNGKTAKAKYDADALLVGNTTVDESYLFDGAKVTFDGDMVVLAMGSDNHQYDLSETDRLLIGFSHTFKLTANQDPAKTSDYYSTFFTSEGAYKVPETAKAYIGEVKKGEDIDVLNLTATADGLIPASEAVVLRATKSDVVLMPSCSKVAASDDNMLQGSDEPMTLPTNSYALSLGQHGVGFYDFSGSVLPANKAYLTLDASAAQSVGLRFSFGDATEIDAPVAEPANAPAYNLQGQQVDETYRGIVIVNGKKVLKR